METTRHFTATTIVVNNKKVLLHLHKKLNVWLPVGGHIDRDELPQVAAIREVKEETGLDIELYSSDISIDFQTAKQLIRPIHILLEDINDFHQHIDFIYYAKSNTPELDPQVGESKSLQWFTADEVGKLSNTPFNVRLLSYEALKLLS